MLIQSAVGVVCNPSVQFLLVLSAENVWKCRNIHIMLPTSQYHKPGVSVHGHMRDNTAKLDDLADRQSSMIGFAVLRLSHL